jgi:hypothetical protein
MEKLERREAMEALVASLQKTLQDPDTRAIFGAPVDTIAIPNYLSIVDNPRDLQSICNDAERSIVPHDQDRGVHYSSYKDVLADVRLVWQNCFKYNTQSDDSVILELCERSRRLFKESLDTECRKRGIQLVDPAVAGIAGVGDSLVFGGSEEVSGALPIKNLDLFDILSASEEGEPVDLLNLGQMRCLGEIAVASGTLQAPRKKKKISLSISKNTNKDSDAIVERIHGEEILDWAVGWSTGAGSPGQRATVYLITKSVWFRLHTPSSQYADTYQNLLTGLDLVQMSMNLAERTDDSPIVKDVVEAAAKELKSTLGAKDAKVHVPAHVKKFAVSHMEGLYGQRVDSFRLAGTDEIDGLGNQEHVDLEAELSRQLDVRGEPPEMETKWRAPKEKIHDLLFVWSFLQEFGDVLKLAPFTLDTLEAALCPGPSIDVAINDVATKEAEEKSNAKGAAPSACSDKMESASAGTTVERTRCRAESIATESVRVDTADDEEGDENQADVKQEEPDEGRGCITMACDHSDRPRIETEVTEKLTSECEVERMEREGSGDKGSIHNGNAERPAASMQEEIAVRKVDGAPELTGALETSAPSLQPSLPVKRGRGRPRKDGMPPIPRSLNPKVAAQNLILDPTVRTRGQRGVAIQVKKFDDFAMDDDRFFDGDDYVPAKQRRKVAPKHHRGAPSWDAASGGQNELSEAIKEAQKQQEVYESNIKEKYGVSIDTIRKARIVDRPYAPSGVLIRDIVLALLSIVDGTLQIPKSGSVMDRPATASTYVSRNLKVLWPSGAANTVWSWIDSSASAKDAALHLAYGDFVDLSPAEKIEILSTLVSNVIESKLLSVDIAKRAEKYSQRHTGRFSWRCVKPHGEDMAKGVQRDIDRVMQKDNAVNKSLPKWMAWVNLLGLGTLAHVGDDANGRRYWALGKESGAFRIYCQVIENDVDSWGWYEGSHLQELVKWLKACDVRSERPLVAALSTAPFSTSGDSSKLIESSRADGYRNITLPLLRGEFSHCNNKPVSLTLDQRASRAIESMLGSISFWFEGDSKAKLIVGISDVLLKGQPSTCSKALLEADKLLINAGKTSREWVDLWSPLWRTTVVQMSDIRDVLLHISALQRHVNVEDDVITRTTFLKLRDEMHSVQAVPLPNEEVSICRTAALQHVDNAMHLLGLIKKPTKISLKIGGNTAPASAEERQEEMPFIKESSIEVVKAQWESLKDRICRMNHIEQYTVRCIVYRKRLVDFVHSSWAEGQEGKAEVFEPLQPVAWVHLKPSRYALPRQSASDCITVPLVLNAHLDDFFTLSADFKKSMGVGWKENDRFRVKGPAGSWRKGTVIEDFADGNQDIDPWQSLHVAFDDAVAGETERISPWRLEIDVEEEKSLVSKYRKLEQNVARSQRRFAVGASNDEEAAMQQIELAAEREQLQHARRRAARAEVLLAKATANPLTNPEEVENSTFFGPGQLEEYSKFLSCIGDELYGKYAAYNAAAKSRAKAEARAEKIVQYPTGPLTPGQQIDCKILDALRLLPKEQFLIMLENFYTGLKGRFKIPVFAHRELDLHRVWWSVMDRFGYENVCAEKQWRDVAKSLNVDLTGQTSASFNMRLNYERCLLDFENYLACGQYEADVAEDKAPSYTHLTNPATTRFVIPGAYPESQQLATKARALASSSCQVTPIVPHLMNQTSGTMNEPEKEAPASKKEDQSLQTRTAGTAAPLKLKLPLKFSNNTSPNVSSPSVVSPTKLKIKLKPLSMANGPSKVTSPRSEEKTAVTVASKLKFMGMGSIGTKIQLYWPDEGGWWNAEVLNYDGATKKHQLVYNKGQVDESFEWIDLAELKPEEIREEK